MNRLGPIFCRPPLTGTVLRRFGSPNCTSRLFPSTIWSGLTRPSQCCEFSSRARSNGINEITRPQLQSLMTVRIHGAARFISTRRPPKFAPFSPVREFLDLVPPSVKITAVVFVVASVAVFVAFPMIIAYMPIAILAWLFYRRRQNILRSRQFEQLWNEMTKQPAADTTFERMRKLDVPELVGLVEKRVSQAFLEDGDAAYDVLGLDPERSRGKLYLGVCEAADREIRMNDGFSEVATVLKFGLMRDMGQGRGERVANVNAVITSYIQYSLKTRSDLEKTAMKVTLESHGKEWTLNGITHDADYANETIIDVKPHERQ